MTKRRRLKPKAKYQIFIESSMARPQSNGDLSLRPLAIVASEKGEFVVEKLRKIILFL